MSLRLYDGSVPPGDVDPIFLQTFKVPVITSCGHLFDRESLKAWIVRQAHCPICRTPISREELENIKTRFEIFCDAAQSYARTTNLRRFLLTTITIGSLFMIVLEYTNTFTYIYGNEGPARQINQFGQIFTYTVVVITIAVLQHNNEFTRRMRLLTIEDAIANLTRLYHHLRP